MFGKESSSSSSSNSNNKKPLFPKKRKRADAAGAVETVVASTGFPISKKNAHMAKKSKSTTTAARDVEQQPHQSTPKNASVASSNRKGGAKEPQLLDWHATAQEVRQLGATAFVKQQKRNYEDEEYFRLTGRHRKKQHVPLPVARGIRKKAAARQAAALAEAKAAGHVLPATSSAFQTKHDAKKKRGNHGPAPSIGFVKKGVLQLKKKPV